MAFREHSPLPPSPSARHAHCHLQTVCKTERQTKRRAEELHSSPASLGLRLRRSTLHRSPSPSPLYFIQFALRRKKKEEDGKECVFHKFAALQSYALRPTSAFAARSLHLFSISHGVARKILHSVRIFLLFLPTFCGFIVSFSFCCHFCRLSSSSFCFF